MLGNIAGLWSCLVFFIDSCRPFYVTVPRKQVQCVVLFKIIFLVEWNRCRIVDFHCVCEVIFVVIKGGRQVFERWMEWEPEEQAWHSYINFELRYKELDRARMIYERYILFHAWILEFYWYNSDPLSVLFWKKRIVTLQKKEDFEVTLTTPWIFSSLCHTAIWCTWLYLLPPSNWHELWCHLTILAVAVSFYSTRCIFH